VATAIAAIEKPGAIALERGIREIFDREPDRDWRNHIEAVAAKLAGSEGADE
jgi:hypothetical protein